jgi:hypothetical protein
MLLRVGESFSALTGASSLPALMLGLAASFALVACVLALLRAPGGVKGERLLRISLIVLVAAIGFWLLDHSSRRDGAAGQDALDARAFELAARGFVPGSPLACLTGAIGETVEEGCERTLFASPETTAAAVSFVAAQLSLLADAHDHARRGGPSYGHALTNLRRMIEADRFGIVAHVLATRDGCTPDQCAAFGFLQGTGRVSANLTERPFEAYLKSYTAAWQSGGVRAAGTVAPPAVGPTASALPTKPASSALFPSSTTTPQINIMATEPPGSHQLTRDAAAGAESASSRKPASAPAPGRQPPSVGSAPANAPLQLGPNAP